ncbi:MAG TPA: hypothetical protein VL362_00145 [Patescibacteria group bacterium]|jgi:hypothetical protein|nr:hypothetical protein [Patescibacteria group bacterium]
MTEVVTAEQAEAARAAEAEAAQAEEAARFERQAPTRMLTLGKEVVQILLDRKVPTVPIWTPVDGERSNTASGWERSGEGWHLLSSTYNTHNEMDPVNTIKYLQAKDGRFGTFDVPGLIVPGAEFHGIVDPNLEPSGQLLRVMQSELFERAVAYCIVSGKPLEVRE